MSEWTPENVKEILEIAREIIIAVAGVVLFIWGKRAAESTREDMIRRTTRGAYEAVAAKGPVIASKFNEAVDDVVGKVEEERGKLKEKEKTAVRRIVGNLNLDPDMSNLTKVTDAKKAILQMYEGEAK